MTNLARSSLALVLPALFGAAKSCALVKFFMICPRWSPSRQPTTNQIVLLIRAISWHLCEHVAGRPPEANCPRWRTIFIAAACRDRARRLVCDCAFAVELGKLGLGTLAKALAPTSSISGAPLPKGGSFLNHRPSRSASVP